MTHRFPIKEIARQAGVGTATVDRVLNDRPNVSPQTRLRVRTAISELEGQEQQLAARGRRLFVDFVVEAPTRFSAEIRRATEAVLPGLASGVFRPRFLFQEIMTDVEVIGALERIRRKGTQGICLKARDLPRVRAKVDELVAAGIPIVTLVTDLPSSRRVAYVGLDNRNAGQMAAFLIATALGGRRGQVLAYRSQEAFHGEVERFDGFCKALRDLAPSLEVIDVSGGAGLATNTRRRVEGILAKTPDLAAVYSMGGGNEMILRLLADYGHIGVPFVAHDLDSENTRLLADGALSFVLHHDLEADMRTLFRTLASAHGLAEPYTATGLSDVEIITRFNKPRRA